MLTYLVIGAALGAGLAFAMHSMQRTGGFGG